MSLLQKKPQFTSDIPLYTIGSSKTILVVGLGNPGQEYKNTRHNIGFETVETFAKSNDFFNWLAKKDLKAEICSGVIRDTKLILAKPTTFMNESGAAIAAVQNFYRIYNQNTLLIYDELALQFGQLRLRLGGSDAGHNGIKSLIQHVGEDFYRLRIGVANETSAKADAANFVLGKFSKKEQESLPLILNEAITMVNDYIFGGKDFNHETRNVL